MFSKAVMLAVLFAVVANPATYKLTSQVLGSWIASGAGCPTQNGVVLHAAVFVGLVFAIMMFKRSRSSSYMYSGYEDPVDGYDVETYAAGQKLRGFYGNRLYAKNKWKKSSTGKPMQLVFDLDQKRYKWIYNNAKVENW